MYMDSIVAASLCISTKFEYWAPCENPSWAQWEKTELQQSILGSHKNVRRLLKDSLMSAMRLLNFPNGLAKELVLTSKALTVNCQ